jgi:hypothetical protein
MRNTTIRKAIAGVAGLLVVGFVAFAMWTRPVEPPAAGARQTAGPSPTPLSSATDGAGSEPCWTSDIHADLLPQTASTYATQSRFVGVGTFTGFGPAFWNTADAQAPSSAKTFGDALILTEIFVDFQSELRGSADGVRLAIRGGEIGCSYMNFPNPPDLAEGHRYLFFGSGPFDADGHFTMWVAWPFTAGGLVGTPEDGDLSLDNVGSILRAYPVHEDGAPVATAPPSEPPTVEGTPDTVP